MTSRVPVAYLCVVGVLVLALMAPAAAVVPATVRPDRAPTSRALDASTPQDPLSPGWTRLDVVDHNIERRAKALGAALRRAKRVHARVIALQEVCWWHVRDLRAQHPKWSIAWQPDDTSERCRLDASLSDLADRDRIGSGNVVIWTGGTKARSSSHVFRSQVDPRFRQGVVCLHVRASVTRHFCSTHLANPKSSRRRHAVQLRQARHLRRITGRWVDRGDLVVLAGDLNAFPVSRTLDLFYDVDGRGHFLETTACPDGVDLCRRSLGPTFDGGKAKIDYIFFSVDRVPPRAPHALRLQRTSSDHHLLSGWAYVERR